MHNHSILEEILHFIYDNSQKIIYIMLGAGVQMFFFYSDYQKGVKPGEEPKKLKWWQFTGIMAASFALGWQSADFAIYYGYENVAGLASSFASMFSLSIIAYIRKNFTSIADKFTKK